MRCDVDVQTASAIGAIVRGFRTYRSGNVGVQQFAKIARRSGNEAGTVPLGCNRHGTERSGLKREPYAERVAIAKRFA